MNIWKTRLTELLNIQYPIIQGGLAHLAYADLAAAVSNAGGLGQLTAMTCESPATLKKEIHRLRELTGKPFGVNFAIGQHGRPYMDYLEVAIREGVPAISITGGNPAPVLKALEGTNIKTLILVSSRRQAVKAEQLGADAVMAVGYEGGGHLGRDDIGTMVLVPSIVDAVSIPVAASGGFGDGNSFMAALALGAEGIEMGTRFIATKECVGAHPKYKDAILNSAETDTVIIKKGIGATARVLHNDWADKILEIEKRGGTYDDLQSYISGKSNRRFIHDGVEEEGFGWAGQIIGRIHDIPTVSDLFNTIFSEALVIREKWGRIE